ncbi:hypothetical protein ACFOD3_25190 [Falsiroseomonas tokyonensis]|uniref:Uncharacterized protein n=2 Tax=Falsiroseomonas tokyonensis TaxID=430521 RepID=A0ABV7C1J7_9PROT|nr:hypothetical protein [Falsiroseomonas tokyonensis]
MEIVNGYPCRDCTDVARAKKNIDPAKPEQGAAPKPEPAWVAAAAAAGVPQRLLDLYV